jgi:hypothetical protein
MFLYIIDNIFSKYNIKIMISLLDLPCELIEEIVSYCDFSIIRNINKYLLDIANKIQINNGKTLKITMEDLFNYTKISDYYYIRKLTNEIIICYHDINNKIIYDLLNNTTFSPHYYTELFFSWSCCCNDNVIIPPKSLGNIILPSVSIINYMIEKHPLYFNNTFRINTIKNTIKYITRCIYQSQLHNDIKHKIIEAYTMHIKQFY